MAWTKEDAERLQRGEVQGRRIEAPILLIRPKLKPFKSHVDGSVITTHRELQHHNLRNDVAPMEDFIPLWEEKAKEREKIFDSSKSSSEERKKDIIQVVEQLKR